MDMLRCLIFEMLYHMKDNIIKGWNIVIDAPAFCFATICVCLGLFVAKTE